MMSGKDLAEALEQRAKDDARALEKEYATPVYDGTEPPVPVRVGAFQDQSEASRGLGCWLPRRTVLIWWAVLAFPLFIPALTLLSFLLMNFPFFTIGVSMSGGFIYGCFTRKHRKYHPQLEVAEEDSHL